MKDYELATRREIEVALLNKGQESKRYKLGEQWELNYDEIREALDKLTSGHMSGYKELIRTLRAGIVSTTVNDSYSYGFRNGIRWCMALIDDKEPEYEKLPKMRKPETELEIVHCKDCKHTDKYCHCDLINWWNTPNDFCSKGEFKDPYDAIGQYIRGNVKVVEDIIAVIELDGKRINTLYLADTESENLFTWNTDWWEGEKDVKLINFFPVSDAVSLKEANAAVLYSIILQRWTSGEDK